jgi:hypothetical protein
LQQKHLDEFVRIMTAMLTFCVCFYFHLLLCSWDWRKVTEDERMYVCVATGELIHPCHYEGQFAGSTP